MIKPVESIILERRMITFGTAFVPNEFLRRNPPFRAAVAELARSVAV